MESNPKASPKASPKVILVTGASSGIGALCAEALAAQGHTVYAASRRGSAPPACRPLVMDVDEDSSVDAGMAAVLDTHERLDAAVLCAGWGLAGAVEDTHTDEARAQFETNLFGVHRVCRAALPAMRRQRAGRIVLISSLAARMPLPYQAFYAASKAALSSYAEALRLEMAPHGVKVVSVEPGNFRTGFTGSRRRVSGWSPDSAHDTPCTASVAWMENGERRAPAPDAVVRRVARVLADADPATHHVVAASLVERLGAGLRALLPQRLYEPLALRVFRVR